MRNPFHTGSVHRAFDFRVLPACMLHTMQSVYRRRMSGADFRSTRLFRRCFRSIRLGSARGFGDLVCPINGVNTGRAQKKPRGQEHLSIRIVSAISHRGVTLSTSSTSCAAFCDITLLSSSLDALFLSPFGPLELILFAPHIYRTRASSRLYTVRTYVQFSREIPK